MPVIIAHVKLEWLGGGWQPYTSRPVETDRSNLMRELVQGLRPLALRAVNDVSSKHECFTRGFCLEDVILDVQPVHQWSENVPDLRVEIHLSDLDVDEGQLLERRWAIARNVSGHLFSYLDQDKFLAGPRPSYSVECLPKASSGIERDSFGAMKLTWGVPDYSDAPRSQFVLGRDDEPGGGSGDDPYQPPTR